jgi:hypothetical protein
MFYSDTQSGLNFLRILNRLEVGVFARAVKLESPCTYLKITLQLPLLINILLNAIKFGFY